MSTWRRPNQRLREAMTEAGWTGQQLAAAVNSAAAEAGLSLSYDRTAVAHWLAGTRPRSPVPDLLAEVFTRRLGLTVTAAGLGLAAGGASETLVEGHDADAGSVLTGLHEAGRRWASSAPAYSLAALAIPAWEEPKPGWPELAVREGEAPVTVADAEAAEALLAVLAGGDVAFGGGHVWQATAAYLSAGLVPKLRARMTPALRQRLFAVTTQLAYLCGFMCFDQELQGLSQRYYRAALLLAHENGDRAGYAIAVRALSVQAVSLGHYRQARTLAETAVSGIRQLEPRQHAFLYGQLAVARAADGDRPGALTSLADAERSLDQATSATAVTGAYHLASFAHQQAATQDLLGDRLGAIASLDVSIRNRPADERRSRAITLALLADLQLSAGRLAEAVHTGHRFLDVYPYLECGRATSALRTLRARIRPLSKNPGARALLERAADSGRQTAG